MILIVIVIVGLLYIGAALWATTAVVRSVRSNGGSRTERWFWGGGVAFVFYLIPFWDWIPTIVAHRYYCATEARFDERKTISKWKTENADILESLRYNPEAKIANAGAYRRFPLNQRLASESKDVTPMFLAVRRQEGRIIDTSNGEVLAEFVEFITGYSSFSVGGAGAWKFWLDMGACSGRYGYRVDFEKYYRAVQELGGGAK